MGWETAAIAGFQALSVASKLSQAGAESEATIQQAQNENDNIADNTLRTVGKLKTSFLSSGLALDEGTQAILSQAFAKGQTDILRNTENANRKSSNAYYSARAGALDKLAQSSLDTFGDNPENPFSLNGVGQTVAGALDPSPTGPYLPPTWLR